MTAFRGSYNTQDIRSYCSRFICIRSPLLWIFYELFWTGYNWS